jgi:hypothetical protein
MMDIPPPDPSRLNDPEHWREKADETPAKAEDMCDTEATETMERVAEECRAERWRHESETVKGSYAWRTSSPAAALPAPAASRASSGAKSNSV